MRTDLKQDLKDKLPTGNTTRDDLNSASNDAEVKEAKEDSCIPLPEEQKGK